VLAEDDRPPILFLRSFEDDQISLKSTALPAYAKIVDPGMKFRTFEDLLQVCVDIGPPVAIGHPDDTAPPVGVPRQYVRGGDWREVVLALIDKASLIVVGVAASSGVLWEIEQLRNRNALGRTVFIMPPPDSANYALLAELLWQLCGDPDPTGFVALRTMLSRDLHGQQISGLVAGSDCATVFASNRPLSQVEMDATLRLSLLSRSAG
jgi:hypothetical protein